MTVRTKMIRSGITALLCVLFLAVFAANSRTMRHGAVSGHEDGSDPWSSAQAIQAADFAKELNAANPANKPTVVCVGFRPLYQGAHIPGALFHGAASTEAGIADLKSWAQNIPRSSRLVLYCGCCPLAHCPNIKPAFAAMRDMGFSNLRVLILPNDFNTDWIEKGYPVEKGK